jgi:hypothetical protein
MSDYECKRCGGIFEVKKNLIQHLKKKKECISINSESSRDELLKDVIDKEGIECEGCGKKYSNIYNMRRHNCKGMLEKRIIELEKILNGLIKKDDTVKQAANRIKNNNIRIKNIDNITTNSTTNNITNNITNNVTVVINDIDSINGIDYILKDPRFTEKILKWVTDKNGLLKYMDEKYYNPKRPENRGIRKVDNENIELHMKGDWNKYDNKTALYNIIDSLRMDWDKILGRMKDNYWDDYENNKKELVVFKREVSDPLDMELDITDDEDETKEKTKQLVCVDGNYELVEVKDEVMVKKEKKWNDKILKIVK